MNKNILILLIFTAITTVLSIRIGIISNTMFIAATATQILLNMTCTQCTCTGLMSSAVGWNCIIINNTCYLIQNYSSNPMSL